MSRQISLAVLSVIIACWCGACRTLNGHYDESFGEGWGGAEYEFHNDGTFKYSSRYDVGGEYGTGTYSIRFGKLKLRFETAVSEPYTSASYCFTRRDSTETNNKFVITVRDESRSSIPFASITYLQSGDTSKYAVTTDIDGIGQLSLANDVDSIAVRVRTIVYDEFAKQINVHLYDSITIYLFTNPRYGQAAVPAGSVWKYSFRQKSKSEVELIDRRIEMVELGDGYSYKRVRHRDVKKLTKRSR